MFSFNTVMKMHTMKGYHVLQGYIIPNFYQHSVSDKLSFMSDTLLTAIHR